MNIKIYTRSNCTPCKNSKILLKSNLIKFEEISLDINEELLKFKETYPNITSVPAIFIDDRYIGGYKELVNYIGR